MNTFIPKQDNVGPRLNALAVQAHTLRFNEDEEWNIERLVTELERIFTAAANRAA